MKEPVELDLAKLLRCFALRWRLLLAGALVGSLLALVASATVLEPRYESSVTFYVTQTQSGRDLAESFAVIAKMRESLMEVIAYTGITENHVLLERRIDVTGVADTDFFLVTVSGPDPGQCAMLANAMGVTLPRQIGRIMEGTEVKVVGEAIPALEPASPSYPGSAALGAVLGLLAASGVILLTPEGFRAGRRKKDK